MSDINPLAPAEDATQEAAEVAPAVEEPVAPAPALQIPAWAVMPDGGRIGAAVEEPVAEETAVAEEVVEPEAVEYDGARLHQEIPQVFNQGT